MDQSKANQWIHVLLPVLLAVLAHRLDVAEADAAIVVVPLEEAPRGCCSRCCASLLPMTERRISFFGFISIIPIWVQPFAKPNRATVGSSQTGELREQASATQKQNPAASARCFVRYAITILSILGGAQRFQSLLENCLQALHGNRPPRN
jgi:hypothetical protein